MKRFFALALSLLVILEITSGCSFLTSSAERGDFDASGASHQLQEDAPSPLPEPTSFVSDTANVLDEATRAKLKKTLSDFKNQAQVDFYVVTVPTTGNQSVFDYSLAVARGWGVGAKNPDKAGLLLLVAINDRKWHIQLSRSVNKIIPDKEAGELASVMIPHFRQGEYGEGLIKGVDAFIKVLSERRKPNG